MFWYLMQVIANQSCAVTLTGSRFKHNVRDIAQANNFGLCFNLAVVKGVLFGFLPGSDEVSGRAIPTSGLL